MDGDSAGTCCRDFEDRLDDYIDGSLAPADVAAYEAHLAGCGHCRLETRRSRDLRALLANYGRAGRPLPDAGWFATALERAAGAGARERRNRWLLAGVGTAIAATVVLAIVASPPLPVPEAGPPAVAMTVAAPRTVNLVFAATAALDDAELTLELPAGVELDGFPGQRRLRWRTSLAPGQNLLPLRLIANEGFAGELVARLEHGGSGREYRVRLVAAGNGA